MSEKRWTIGRPINGVSLNDLEYLCDNAGRQLMYDSEESARADLRRYGYSDKRIEDEGIVICCFNEGDYMASLKKRNEEFEARIAELESKHWNECGQIAHYDDERKKIREYLQHSAKTMTVHGVLEALALIGEGTNVPASADGTNVGHKSGDWISCKDRMPEVNEPVLFIFNTESGFKAVMYGWHETIKGLGSGWHQAGVGGARADEEVTYWQPLPEPPKDGERNG